MDLSTLKIAYVHGRPCSHPMQQKMARSIGAHFIPVDFRIRWHDKESSRLRRYLSWLVCALTFPEAKSYDLFIAAGTHTTLPLMRTLFRIKKNQKIILYLGDEMLYFLYSNYYSPFTKKNLIGLMKKYDAIMIEGQMGSDIARSLLGSKCPPLYTIFNGMQNDHYEQVKNVVPDLLSKNIIFIGQGPSNLRYWYKGLDLMLRAFSIAFQKDSSLRFKIVGDWDNQQMRELVNSFQAPAKNAITFVNFTNDLASHLKESALLLHCARGEAYGITVLLALAAGVPALVSEWTGTKEVIQKIDPSLITVLDENTIAEKIHQYFRLPEEQKRVLSNKAREIAGQYTESRVIENYRKTMAKLITDIR